MTLSIEELPCPYLFLEAYHNNTIYSDVAWLTAHNAFANREEGWMYTQQSFGLNTMFDKGVRSFMLDVHECQKDDGGVDLFLCHGGCTETAAQKPFTSPTPFMDWLTRIQQLLHGNTQDIITLHIESYVMSDQIYKSLENNGLQGYLLKSKNPNDLSLSLGYMRQHDERLVIFSDYKPERNLGTYFNSSSGALAGIHAGLFPTLNYKETQYSLDNFDKCEMRLHDFRADPDDPNIRLFVLNHFSPVSVLKDYNTMNRYSYIMNRVKLCLANGLFPNFIAVDYFELGDCAPCQSTSMVVYNLNHLNQHLIRNVTAQHVTYEPQKNVTDAVFSHTYSIGNYLINRNSIGWISFISIDWLVYRYEQSINYAVNEIRGPKSVAHRNLVINNIAYLAPIAIHVVAETNFLYLAYYMNTILFTVSLATTGLIHFTRFST